MTRDDRQTLAEVRCYLSDAAALLAGLIEHKEANDPTPQGCERLRVGLDRLQQLSAWLAAPEGAPTGTRTTPNRTTVSTSPTGVSGRIACST